MVCNMTEKFENNLIKIYLMVFCRSTMLVAAVFVPLLQSHGLTMTEIMHTQALFALTIAFSEVPSGYLADVWGRKNTLIAGSALCALGFGLLVQANDFTDFLVYEFLLGIGISLNSGADLALLYDTETALRDSGKQPLNHRPIAKMFSIEGIAGAAGAIAAGILAFWSLQWVVIGQALIGLLPLFCAMTLLEPPRKVVVSSHSENFAKIKATVIEQPLVLITAAAMIIFGLAAMYVFWLYQKYWEFLGVPLTCFGFLWAIHCVIRGSSAHFAHKLEQSLGSRTALALVAGLSIFGILGMATNSGWIGICLAFVLPFSRGLSSVIFTDALNKRINAEFRATLNSLVSLGFRAVFIVTAPIFGWLVDSYGVQASLYVLAIIFTPAYIFILIALFATLNKPKQASDSKIPVSNN